MERPSTGVTGKQVRQAAAAAVLTLITASAGAGEPERSSSPSSTAQAVDELRSATIFDQPVLCLSREQAFALVRRAVQETGRERIWAYVPGKLVLLGIEMDASLSVEADMEILTALMRQHVELDLLHTHVKQYFSCTEANTRAISPAHESLCRTQNVEILKNSVPSPYDLANAIIAASLYDSLQPGGWRLSNFVFTPISTVRYGATPTGLYRLKLRGASAIRTKLGLIGSYNRDFAEKIVPKNANGVLSAEDMHPYVQTLVSRYAQFSEFTMTVVLDHEG